MSRNLVCAMVLALLLAVPGRALANRDDNGAGHGYRAGNGHDDGRGDHGDSHGGPAPILGAGVPLYLLAAAGYRSWKRRQDREALGEE